MRTAIAGLGTVGAEVVRQLLDKDELYAQRAERPITVTDVSARDRKRDRGFPMRDIRFWKDPVKMAREAKVDLVVELIGGADGVAKRVVEAAIAAGKHVVTANKALLARHGMQLARAAEERGVTLAFEAAVAGSIPAVEILRQALVANIFSRVGGILNGTCNYILWRMSAMGCTFDQSLAEAQEAGYAEADPSRDISGKDTADKLAILAALAFGVPVDLSSIHVEGIEQITALDIQRARELGMGVKLLGIARLTEQGLERWVHPCLVPADAVLAMVPGATNAVSVTGDLVETQVYLGQGAGAKSTTSAVIADILDLATGRRLPAFGKLAAQLRAVPVLVPRDRTGEYYLRLQVADQPRVLGDVLSLLGMQGVSVASNEQPEQQVDPDGTVAVFLTTHRTQEAAVQRALTMIRALPTVKGEPCLIRIEREV
ncbi:homoserine dehydrogenase [Candidatus Uhrbacteria bacterium]|nr:homoserine dehydrogenase [Candidatus Uhrbacteria bacterium]